MSKEIEILRRRIEEIRAMAGDWEAAHGAEDRLREQVLQAIADGIVQDPAAVAKEVLRTSEIDFPRYCA